VLLVGGRAIAGTDGHGLASALALGLAGATGNGVDVETVDADPLAEGDAEGRLLGRDLSRTDALVVVLDPSRATAVLRDTLRRLLAGLTRRLTPGSALVAVVPSARTATLRSRDLDRFTAVVRETADQLTPVLRLEELPGTDAEDRLGRWAAAIAEVTANAVIEPMVRFLPHDPYDEYRRVDAVGAVGRRYTGWVDTFQDLVEAARTRYGTASAAMSIIDDETTRYFVRSGNVAVSLPRGKSVCNRVLQIFGGLIMGDARLDRRFSGLPEVRSGAVRFYAGYRITGPDGAPFGALCVFDPKPRAAKDEDLSALRDLALAAQRRLWRVLPAASAA
jgi:hypothetical protein